MRTNIGLDVKPPEKECSDERCAWHGKIALRGKVFSGIVSSSKAHNTIVIEWGYHRYVRKYERYERRRSSVVAYNPPCIHAVKGDKVVIAECRPLSKTKHFVVVSKEKQ